MIDVAAARALADRLRQVEERLGRLLTSGWRQARDEAAGLRADAAALAEIGLTEIGARVMAVAQATDPAEALRAIALATSACRLMRTRLPSPPAPDGWTPLVPSGKAQGARTESLVPISRALLDSREVWVCTRTNRNELLLLDPPFPNDPPVAREPAPPPVGILGRLRQQVGQALGGETSAPSHWLRRRLAGTLRWQAQYPLGPHGDVGSWKLDDPSWAKDSDDPEQQAHRAGIQDVVTMGKLQDGAPLFWTAGGFRIRELDRDETAAYVWLDPSAATAFRAAPTEKVWAIAWAEGATIVPVALLTPAGKVTPPRLTHLIPGAPRDTLAMPA
jgi:hypothetical protein